MRLIPFMLMAAAQGDRIIALLEHLVRLSGGYVPRPAAPALTPERRKGLVSVVPRRPTTGGMTDPDEFWSRPDPEELTMRRPTRSEKK
jgi:hypothetical protein